MMELSPKIRRNLSIITICLGSGALIGCGELPEETKPENRVTQGEFVQGKYAWPSATSSTRMELLCANTVLKERNFIKDEMRTEKVLANDVICLDGAVNASDPMIDLLSAAIETADR